MSRTALLLALALAPLQAHAMSCIDHAWETMDVEFVGVTSEGKEVDPPPELEPLDQLMNSCCDGQSILFWEEEGMGFAKWYALVETYEPEPVIVDLIGRWKDYYIDTACGYDVYTTPILPGRYVFSEEHVGGEKTPKGIQDPVLHVAPGRAEVALEFTVRDVPYRATYRVTCAYFTFVSNYKSCAEAGGGFEQEPVDDVDVEVPWSGTPDTPPEVEPSQVGCAGCTMGGEAALVLDGVFVVLLLLANRRRKR